MTRLLTCGFETGATSTATANDPEGQGIARVGTINSIISTNSRISGLRARVNASVAGQLTATWATAAARTFYQRICFYFTSVTPSVNTTIASLDNAGLPVLALRLRTDGKLILLDGNSATINSTLTTVLSINTWYVVEFSSTTPASGLATYIFKIDTSQIDTGTYTSNNFTIDGATIGRGNAAETNVGLLMDDWAVNDSTGIQHTTFPGSGHIVFLQASADNAQNGTGWLGGSGGTFAGIDMSAAMRNVPPVGVAVGASSTDTTQIEDIANNSTDTVTFDTKKFTDTVATGGGGLGADDSVVRVHALARGGTNSTTARTLAVTGVAPALAEGTITTGTTTAAAEPTGWVTVLSTAANTVADITATPAVKVRKGTASTTAMTYDLAGIMCEYQVPQTKSLSDSVTLSDAATKAVGKPQSDSVTLSDAAAKSVSAPKSDSVTLSDTPTKAVGKPASDSVTLSDASAKSVGQNPADSTTLSDSPSKSVGKPESDSTTLTDEITTKGIGLFKDDSVTLSDVFSRVSSFILGPSDSVTLTDQLSNSVGKSFADSITLSDAKALVVAKGFTDSLTLSDATVRGVGKVFSDSSTLSDDLTSKTIGVFLSDSITLSDVLALVGQFVLSLSDTITLTDTATTTAGYSRTASDSVTLSDDIVKAPTLYISDTISLTDVFSKSSGFFLALADDLTLTDALSKSVAMSFEDVVTLADFMARVLPLGIISSAAKILGFSTRGDQFSTEPKSSDFSTKHEGEVGNDPHV